MGYTNYWTQNKIDAIPDGLIYDIKKLFKCIYKNNYKYIYLVNKDNSDSESDNSDSDSDNNYKYNHYDDCCIYKLNSNIIEIHTPCEWFVVDNNKSGFEFCKTYGRWYDYIVKCLIMLSVHYNVIKNDWSDDGYHEDTIKKCKKVLNKIGYTIFNCNYNSEEGTYHLDMKKDTEKIIQFNTIEKYSVII